MNEPVKLGKPDARGNYKRDLGWKVHGGQYVQHRFYVGKDRAAAMLRVERLDRLWDAIETAWKEQRRSGVGSPLHLGDERPVWNLFTLAVAMAVARGDAEVEIDPAADEDFAHALLSPMGLAEWFGRLSALVAGCGVRLVLTPEGQRVADKGRESIRQYAANRIERARKEIEQAKKEQDAVPRPVVVSTPNGGETLHKALDAFADFLGTKYVTRDGITTPAGKRYQRQTKQIKEYAPDMPLSAFGLAEIEGLLATWQRRPISKRKGTPLSVETVRDVIKRIRQFLPWLHRSPFNWRLPDDYAPARISIKYTAAELSARAQPHGRRTYKVDELCTLWEYASPWERLLIILALNCGFGAAEIATLQLDEITIDGPHGHYPIHGSFIKRIRFKTGVYGEWMLWPETVRAIEWMKRRRGATQETALVVSKNGRPLNQQTAGGSRNMRIPNTWNTLLKRIRRKDFPTFRKLSFNKLRKTAASFVRRKYGGEVAGMFLAHGKVVTDELLERYADRNFRPVFKACRHWRKVLEKMFARVADPFPTSDTKHNPSVTLGTIKRMKELRQQGMPIKAIAAEVGLHRATVRTYLDK